MCNFVFVCSFVQNDLVAGSSGLEFRLKPAQYGLRVVLAATLVDRDKGIVWAEMLHELEKGTRPNGSAISIHYFDAC